MADENVDTPGDGQLFEVVDAGIEPMEGVVEIQDQAVDLKVENESLKGEYTWEINDWSKIVEPKKYSDNFEIGTHIWRILVCPRGMNNPGFLSLYLDSPEAAFAPANLNPTASFRLSIINQKTPGQDYFKDSNHKWSQQETDWGFTQFLHLQELHDPDRGFLVDDRLIIKVEITVQRDERYYYDSRKETGYVGLKNQGATCYMNSLLQYLYHLPYFRKAVYHMPTNENDQPADSLPLALQSLFYKLQYSRTPVSTKDLTKSFGWSTMDAFMQHDVQELNRVLCEKLEEKMKGTRVEKVINELFEGHTLNFIECVNVEYKSSRKESFMDLQLDVKGCKDIYESFDRYCEVEVMSGENQYKAEGHGLQDARKGVLFDSFPPVLQLQLKRFEYDFQRDTMVKINDRYVFYDELDLDADNGRYLSPAADRTVRNKYKLHSVLVHSGGVHGGHYYAYIRPDGKTWLKFDDTAVTIESEEKALNEQFGGEDEPLPAGSPAVKQDGDLHGPIAPKRIGGLKFTKFSNAYMLVYVRESDWPRVMVPVTKDHIAPYLRQRLESEQREKEKRQKDKQEAHLYCHIRVATDADIAQQVGSTQWFDLVDYDKLPPNRTFRVRKLTPFADFKQQVADTLSIPAEQQRYWVWQLRQNETYRPTARLKPDEEARNVLELRDHRETKHTTAKHALMDLRFYLEIPWPQHMSTQTPSRNDINLFFKYYDAEAETLRYVGHRYVPRNMKVRDLQPLLNKLSGLPDNTTLMCYEEVKWEPTVMVVLLQPGVTLGPQAELECGDIICFQKAVPDNAIGTAAAAAAASSDSMSVSGVVSAAAAVDGMDVEVDQQQQAGAGLGLQQQQQAVMQQQQGQQQVVQCRYLRVPEFLSYIRNRRLVTFKKLEEPKEPGFQLELLREQDYDTVTAALAAKLGLEDPTKIRLTQHNAYSMMPQRAPMKYRGVNKLEDMLRHAGHSVDVMYFETLDMPLPQLEQLKSLKVNFHNDKTEFVAEHVIRLPHDSQVGDVLRELSNRLGPDYADRKLRLLEVYHSKIFKVIGDTEEISSVNDSYWLLRAEPVPLDQDEGSFAEGDRIIHVCHISTNNTKTESAGNNSPTHQPGLNNDAAGGGGFITSAPATTAATVTVFGDPLLLRIGPQESVGAVRRRIQEKLGVAAADFEHWKFAFVPVHAQLAYLTDDEVLAERFAAAEGHHGVGQDVNYLGLEHEDKGPRRPAGAARHTYERAVKIYS